MENLEQFKDIFGIELLDLYSDIKLDLYKNAHDLLNEETVTSKNDFVEMIFQAVHFEIPEDNEVEEEFIEIY